MKSNKLKLLLLKVELPSQSDEDELVSLNDELADNLIGVFGMSNGCCSGNGNCSNNTVCHNNGGCAGNGTCGVHIMSEIA